MNYLMAFWERNHVWFYGLMRKRKGLIKGYKEEGKERYQWCSYVA